MQRNILVLLGVVVSVLLQGCFGISNIQSASLLPSKSAEVTGSYSLNTYHSRKTDENDVASNSIGLSALYGIHKNVNVRARYQLILPTYDYTDNIQYLSLGVKVPVVRKYFAFYIPGSLLLSKELSSLNNLFFEPTAISSIYINDSFNINIALSYQIFVEEIDNVVSLSLGGDIHNIIPSTIIRPELSVATHPPTTGLYFTFTIGFSFLTYSEGSDL